MDIDFAPDWRTRPLPKGCLVGYPAVHDHYENPEHMPESVVFRTYLVDDVHAIAARRMSQRVPDVAALTSRKEDARVTYEWTDGVFNIVTDFIRLGKNITLEVNYASRHGDPEALRSSVIIR